MITINNNIDSEYKAKIYYKDKFIGECLNELAFLDVRLQIAKEQDKNYSFELIGLNPGTKCLETSKRFKFSSRGIPQCPADYLLYWPTYDKMLSELLSV